MSLSSNTLVKAVKRAAIEAVQASKPMAMILGVVASSNPLKISVDQKLTLTEAQLMLTNAVRDHIVYITVDHTAETALESIDLSHQHSYSGTTSGNERYNGSTELAGSKELAHSHGYTGKIKHTVHYGLKEGEKVLLLRCDGGQKFIVLDRVEVLS